MKLIKTICLVFVHVLLFIGILGLFVVDNIWKEAGYLLVIAMMMDILYRRLYRRNYAKEEVSE